MLRLELINVKGLFRVVNYLGKPYLNNKSAFSLESGFQSFKT